MELTCVIVLLIVGFATSSPHGYGTKGGVTAKADAHAVAGAYNSGGNIPLSIPSGAGYAGSFSQSSSSSSSSASASSSSRSFSYSGSGTIGGAIPGANGCGSGNCNGGGETGSQGSQVYSGANAGALAGGYGGKIPTDTYDHKYGGGESQTTKAQDCGSEGCQGTNDSGSFNGNDASTGSQSASDAKAAASAGAGLLASSNCDGSDCNRLPDISKKCISGQCDYNAKCSSGDCDAVSHTKDFTLQNGGAGKKCTSGQCGPNQDIEENSSTDYGTNDIHVSTSRPSNRKPSYGATSCSSGKCGLSFAPGSQQTPNYNKPAIELTAPKQELACSGSNCHNLPSGYSSPNTLGNPSCVGGNCGYYSTSSQTKPPYTSHYQGVNQISQTPSPGYGGFSEFPTASSGSENYTPGLPGPLASGVVPEIGIPSHKGTTEASARQDSKKDLPAYTGGFGGPAGVLEPTNFSGPTPSHGDKLVTDKPASPGPGGLLKPSYSHGSSSTYSPVKPSGAACAPGTPGCSITASLSGTSNCASGNCGTSPSAPLYDIPSNIKPTYSSGNLPLQYPVNPSGSACIPGTSGCAASLSASSPSSCPSGNCGPNPTSVDYGGAPSIKPSYSQGSFNSKPSCALGTPGCNTTPSANGPIGCVSGSCAYPSAPGYSGVSNIKPNYSPGNLPSYFPVNPSSPACAPGTPGCIKPSYSHGSSSYYSSVNPSSPACIPGTPGCIKPSFSHGSSSYYSPVNPSTAACTPGTPGCVKPSFTHGSSSYYSPVNPSSPACIPGTPGCVKPSFSHGSSSSYFPVNPLSPACTPGTPGCVKPSYSHDNSPSYTPLKPSEPACAPGTAGCNAVPSVSGPSDCVSGNCGSYPSVPANDGSYSITPIYSHASTPSVFQAVPLSTACATGSPGCGITPSPSSPSDCISGNCGSSPSGPGYDGSSSVNTSYSPESSPAFSQVKPSGSACAPGTPGCSITPHSDPHDCALGNCNKFPPQTEHSGISGIKPTYAQGNSPSYTPIKPVGQGCALGTPGCGTLPSVSSSSPYPGGQSSGIPVPNYGASGAGSSFNQASYGSHGTGSIQASYNKPTVGFSTGSSGSGTYTPGLPSASPSTGIFSEIGSPSYTGNVGDTAGANAQQGTKKDIPPYTGGFGGPEGILKPNEFSASTSSHGNKPAISNNPLTAKPPCSSGICNAQALPIHSHSGSVSASGAQATAGASADANAVAYTGGFGGPPGLLNPYDNGKIDHKGPIGKQLQGSSVGLHQETSGSGIHSPYSNSGSQVGGSALDQANAISTTGVSGGNNHAHDGDGGCGGGCGGSGSGNLGYSGALGLSKSEVSDASSNGLTTAGAVAKSVASASSGARAYGGSYSSSSASAHAGASVKGGYGRR